MANMSMTVNALQCLLQTCGPAAIKTPTYHIFRMYMPHRNGTLLDSNLAGAPTLPGPELPGRPALSVSATASVDGLFVTIVNADLSAGVDAVLLLPDAFTPSSVSSERLTANDIRAENTPEDPNAVSPAPAGVEMPETGRCRLPLPARSVTAVHFQGHWAYPLADTPAQQAQADLDRRARERSEAEVKI